MSDKSHVSMESKICIVCGNEYATGSILLDKGMKQSMESTTCTGVGALCESDQKLLSDAIKEHGGASWIIEIDESKSDLPSNGDRLNHTNVHRTGRVVLAKTTNKPSVFYIDEIPNY